MLEVADYAQKRLDERLTDYDDSSNFQCLLATVKCGGGARLLLRLRVADALRGTGGLTNDEQRHVFRRAIEEIDWRRFW
ncbi:hypothetical protein GCM10011404_33020 [Sphingomonas prati]|nr:hypothetical protein GCM10011404_33020 [Sphingomonas prati]